MCAIDEVVDRRKEELEYKRSNRCWIEVVSSNGESHYVSPYPDAPLCSPDYPSQRGTFRTHLARRFASVFLDPNVVAVRIDPISYVPDEGYPSGDFVRNETLASSLFSRESFDVSGPVLDDALRHTATLRATINHYCRSYENAMQRLDEAESALYHLKEDAELKALAESTYQGDGDGI
jgi:hypothetical protein